MSIMIRTLLLLTVTVGIIVSTAGSVLAQPAQDLPCQSSVFYGNVGSAVHRLQFNGSSVIDLGVLTTPSQNLFGLAYGMDITQGSTNRTLYGSAANASFTQSEIIRFDGAVWTSVVTDSLVYHNAGAYGPFIYFMHSATAGQKNNQCISRLNANGTLTKIFNDTSLVFSVADLAVDSLGNIYCFRGTAIGATTQLTVINPTGAVVQTYSTNLNNLNTFFGSVFLDGTLYLGWNTVNAQLIPVNLNGSSATLGTGIPMPSGISMRDLANCHDSAEVSTQSYGEVIPEAGFLVYPNPSVDGRVMVEVPNDGVEMLVTDLSGKMVYRTMTKAGKCPVTLEHPGVFFLVFRSEDQQQVRKLVVTH